MKILLSFVLAAMVLAGCVLSAPPPRNSRYSVDISQMEKADFMHDTWIYRHPTRRVRDFDNFNLISMKVFPEPVTQLTSASRFRYDQLAARCETKLRGMIAADPASPSANGTKVLDMNVAIIDIKPKVHLKEEGKDVYINDPDAKGTKFEIDCHDQRSGELIFAISTLMRGEEYSDYENPALAAVLEKEFVDWMYYLQQKLTEARP